MDPFAFMDEQPPEDEELMEVDPKVTTNGTKKKRKKESSRSNSPPSKTAAHSVADSEPGPSVPKKPRIVSPQPVVLDDLEIEAKREVAVSAGLTGAQADAGTRLELRHQVSRACTKRKRNRTHVRFAGPPPSLRTSRL